MYLYRCIQGCNFNEKSGGAEATRKKYLFTQVDLILDKKKKINLKSTNLMVVIKLYIYINLLYMIPCNII